MESLVKIPHSALSATLERLAKRGVSQTHLRAIRVSDEFADRIAQVFLEAPFTSPERAQEIMGEENFFGVKDGQKYFGFTHEDDYPEFHKLSVVPFSENTLQKVRETHILVAVFPHRVTSLRSRAKSHILYGDRNSALYNRMVCANERGNTGWALLPKVPLSDSANMAYSEQVSLLQGTEEMPRAQSMVYVMAIYFLKTSKRLYPNMEIRCQDIDGKKEMRVNVGHFREGICFDTDFDNMRRGILKLVPIRWK